LGYANSYCRHLQSQHFIEDISDLRSKTRQQDKMDNSRLKTFCLQEQLINKRFHCSKDQTRTVILWSPGRLGDKKTNKKQNKNKKQKIRTVKSWQINLKKFFLRFISLNQYNMYSYKVGIHILYKIIFARKSRYLLKRFTVPSLD
jgi:hypothetical protein